MKEHSAIEELCSADREVNPETLKRLLSLAVEIAREGREGRKIGTMFILGDTERVLAASKPMILDPLKGHPDDAKRLDDPDMHETIKELALLDGAFIVREDGVVVSACRYVNASATGIDLPLGLGSRHMAAASITRDTRAVAIVVSESSVVRLFDDGELFGEIIPELWLLRHHPHALGEDAKQRTEGDVTVVSKAE